MNSKIVSIFALLTILFSSALCATGNINLHVYGSSSKWWMAVAATNDDSLTAAVEARSASSLEWVPAVFSASWGYYQLSSTDANGFQLPLSFRFTDKNGNKVVATNIMTSFVSDAYLDTQVQYGTESQGAEIAARPTSAPPPAQPTQRASATAAPTLRPSTSAPTSRPSTSAPTAPTTAPATVRPATPNPNADLCGDVSTAVEPVKMLVPLYVYPGAAWDDLLNVSSTGVKIVAIINPMNGPNPSGPDAAYTSYMNKFRLAGIEMVGYVHTGWGARNITEVLEAINQWKALYTGINGIFFDEGAVELQQVPYYTTIYNAVKAKGWHHVVLNPGAQPHRNYFDISTTIVIFENYASELYNSRFDSWVTCAPNAAAIPTHRYRFSSIVHTAKLSDMPWLVSESFKRGMGYVYITDYEGGCCTYNWLNTYFKAQGTYFKSLNAQ